VIEYPEFRDGRSPRDLRVFQVTRDPKGASLIYPDLPSFLADGRRFIVQTSTGPAICDLDAAGTLTPIFQADPPPCQAQSSKFSISTIPDPGWASPSPVSQPFS
jgi:hypothetical protein